MTSTCWDPSLCPACWYCKQYCSNSPIYINYIVWIYFFLSSTQDIVPERNIIGVNFSSVRYLQEPSLTKGTCTSMPVYIAALGDSVVPGERIDHLACFTGLKPNRHCMLIYWTLLWSLCIAAPHVIRSRNKFPASASPFPIISYELKTAVAGERFLAPWGAWSYLDTKCRKVSNKMVININLDVCLLRSLALMPSRPTMT